MRILGDNFNICSLGSEISVFDYEREREKERPSVMIQDDSIAYLVVVFMFDMLQSFQ